MKIYTKTGDAGETSLLGGHRVAKDAPRIAAYGEVDELGAVLGVARTLGGPLSDLLRDVQTDLFALGAQLADPDGSVATRSPKTRLAGAQVELLERAIDAHEADLPPLRTFILPGGSPLGAQLHLARTVCRRAERAVVALGRAGEAVPPVALTYLNRLSDLLFVLARHANHAAGTPEEPW